MMKKVLIAVWLLTAFVTVQAQDVMRKEKDGTYVVNTTTLAQDVEGYAGPTPVEVYPGWPEVRCQGEEEHASQV